MSALDMRERLNEVMHTLGHVDISRDEIDMLAEFYIEREEGKAHVFAGSLVKHAVAVLNEHGIESDEYIGVKAEGLEPPLEPPFPGKILGALALLGTSEQRLSRLEWRIHP